MSSEARLQVSLQILKGNINYNSLPSAFSATVTGSKGPSPGAITATVAGTDVDFSQLVQPALCRLMNLDPTNFVTIGIWYPDASLFFPLEELLPGETFPLRLSRYLGYALEGVGTGTGTSGPICKLHIKADTAPCNVLVEAFEL